MNKKIVSKIINVILVLGVVIGICLLLYPTVSNYINDQRQSKVTIEYEEIVRNMTRDENESIFNEAVSYNETLYKSAPTSFYKPEIVAGYADTLDITGTGVMGYLNIEKIDIQIPVYHGVSEGVLQVAAGHLPGTSLPVGGESTHSVILAHRGLTSAKLFSDLDKLETGDKFTITILDRVYTYEVDQIKIVLPDEVSDLQIEAGKEYCTLLTCTPYGVNSHRLLVRGVRIASDSEDKDIYVANDAVQLDMIIVVPVVAAPMLVIWLVAIAIIGKKNNKKKEETEDGKKLK